MIPDDTPAAKDDSPRFGLLALVCLTAVVACGFVGWLVSTFL
jgi:hypothetical protein